MRTRTITPAHFCQNRCRFRFSCRPSKGIVKKRRRGMSAALMDVSMPQMNGIEATRQICGALPHIRIVGLSTHDDEDTGRAMLEAGAEAYFTKNEGADRLLDHLLSLSPQA